MAIIPCSGMRCGAGQRTSIALTLLEPPKSKLGGMPASPG
jgi:hypothetical protein